MADTIADLQIMLGMQGLNTTLGGLREVSSALGTTAEGASALNRAQLAGGVLASGAALTGIAAGIGAVAEAGISFQDMLITTQNNTTMTTADIAALSDGVLQLARDAGVGTDVLATGFMRAMNITGNTSAALDILRVATESATSTGGNAAATTNVLANAMHEYGLDVSHAATETARNAEVQANAARVMGQLHYAAALGNMTLEEFSAKSGRAIGIAANLGVGIADVSAAFSALTKHGFDAAQAQTQVVDLMTHVINPSKAAQKELDDISKRSGINLRADFSAEGVRTKGIVGIVDDVRTAFQRLGYDESQATAEAMKLVNAQRGGLGLASLIGTGYADYKTDIADLNDNTKILTVTDEAFARTQATVQNQLARLRETFQTTADVLGQAMLPRLGQLLGWVTPLADGIAGWVRAHADAIGPILATVGGVTALVGAGLTLAGTLGYLGLLAAGAALVGTAWATNFGGIRDLVTGVARVVGPTLGALFTAFRTGDFNAAFGTIITAVDTVFGRDVAGGLTLGLSNALNLAQVFRDTFITIGEALQGNWFGGQTESINIWVRTIGRGVQLARDTFITLKDALSGDWFGGDTASINPFVRTIGQIGVFVRALALELRPALGLIGDAFGLLTGGDVAGGMDGFRARLAAFGADVLHQVAGLAGLAVGAWLRVETAFIGWLTTATPRLLEGVGTLFVNLVNLITGSGTAEVEGAIGANMPNAFMQWVGPALPPFLAAVGRFWDTMGTWMHDTALPAIRAQLATWGEAFGSWVSETAAPWLRLHLGLFLAGFALWVTGTALPWLRARGGELAAAFTTWVGDTAWPATQRQLGLWLGQFDDWVKNVAIPWAGPAFLAFGNAIAVALANGIVGGLPQRLRDILHIDTNTNLPGQTITPGSSRGGGGGTSLYSIPLNAGGRGGGATINYSPTYVINGMTYEQGAQIMARESYNELARLLNADSTYPGGGSAPTAVGTVY
jgi:TP901 family phage tail tape measure protein